MAFATRTLARIALLGISCFGIIVVGLGMWSTSETLRATATTRQIATISDGWKRVHLWLIEEETRERKYIIERDHIDRPYHQVAVAALAQSAQHLREISPQDDRITIDGLLRANARYGSAMLRLFDAVDAHDERRRAAIHAAIDPTYDGMEHTIVDEETRYGHRSYLALADLQQTQQIVATVFPILAVAGVVIVIALTIVLRAYRKQSESLLRDRFSQLETAALVDMLTDLGNNRAFHSELARFAAAVGVDRQLAVVDVDHFKFVNDRFGHRFGDSVLRGVADLFRSAAPSARAFRIGGDEFALLFYESDLETAVRELNEVCRRAPNALKGSTVSIGVASLGRDDRSSDVAIEHADLALYEAKNRGRNAVLAFRADLIDSSRSLTARRLAFERIIARPGPLAVAFQPLWRCDGSLAGYEALARFDDEFASPREAFAIADRLDRTIDLDQRCCASIAASLPTDFATTLHVNLSPKTFVDSNKAIEILTDLTRMARLPRERLVVEVSETLAISPDAVAGIAAVRERGFRVGLDNTGTGNAGLALLVEVPFDTVKIDGSLVESLQQNYRSRAIVSGLLLMLERMECTVTFEGVTSTTDVAFCLELARASNLERRCTLQGNALGAPTTTMLESDHISHPMLTRAA